MNDKKNINEITETVIDEESKEKKCMNNMRKIKKKHIICGIVVLVLLALLSLLAFAHFKKPQEPQGQVKIGANTINTLNIDSNQTDVEEANDKLASRYVYFSGFEDATLNADSKIKLTNLEANEDILMKYQIYEADELLYETGLITSGNSVYLKIGFSFSVGEHNLIIKQIPYYDVDGEGNYLPLTYGSCKVKFTIVEK